MSASEPIFTRRFLTGTFASFFMFANYYVLVVVIAGYTVTKFGADLSIAGFAASIFILGAVVARFLSPTVIRLVGRRLTLVVTLVLTVVFSVAYLGANDLGVLLLVRVLHGFCYGIAQTALTSLVSEGIPVNRRGEGFGYYMLSITVGSAIGPFLGTAVMLATGAQVLFVLCAVLAAAGAICALAMGKEKSLPASECKDTSKRATEDSRATEDKLEEETKGAPALEAEQVKTKPVSGFHISNFIEPSAIPASLIIGFLYLSYGAVVTYINSFAHDADLVQAASFFFIAYAVVMFIARPFTGKMFDRGHDKLVMVGGCIISAVGIALLSQARSSVTMLIAACLLGVGIGSVQPSALTLAVRKAPVSQLDVTNSTYFICLDLALGVCPLLFGWMVPVIGYRGLYLCMAFVICIALVLYLVFLKKKMV